MRDRRRRFGDVLEGEERRHQVKSPVPLLMGLVNCLPVLAHEPVPEGFVHVADIEQVHPDSGIRRRDLPGHGGLGAAVIENHESGVQGNLLTQNGHLVVCPGHDTIAAGVVDLVLILFVEEDPVIGLVESFRIGDAIGGQMTALFAVADDFRARQDLTQRTQAACAGGIIDQPHSVRSANRAAGRRISHFRLP